MKTTGCPRSYGQPGGTDGKSRCMHGVFVLRSLPGHQGVRSANPDINMWTESLVIEDNSVLLFVGSVLRAAAAAVEAKELAANPALFWQKRKTK